LGQDFPDYLVLLTLIVGLCLALVNIARSGFALQLDLTQAIMRRCRSMKRSSFARAGVLVALLLMMLLSFAAVPAAILAQDPPADLTLTPELTPFTPTFTATATATATFTPDPTETFTVTPTPTGTFDVITPVFTVTPVPGRPVPIPEPVTVVLFGTGLAALSAAVASRRGKNGK
jgi:hypothetical protein